MKTGFTLVEMLVVLAILSILGILVVIIFTNSLRGTNKSQILSQIKQNGQSVLETMDKTIRNADNPVVCIKDPVNAHDTQVIVVVQNGSYTRYIFTPPSADASTNGFIQQDFPVQPADKYLNIFLTTVCLDPIGTYLPVQTITDTNPQTGVSIDCIDSDCFNTNKRIFTKNQSAGFNDQVTIKFLAKPGVQAPSIVAGQIDPVLFQTSIVLR